MHADQTRFTRTTVPPWLRIVVSWPAATSDCCYLQRSEGTPGGVLITRPKRCEEGGRCEGRDRHETPETTRPGTHDKLWSVLTCVCLHDKWRRSYWACEESSAGSRARAYRWLAQLTVQSAAQISGGGPARGMMGPDDMATGAHCASEN